jgi:hypothetical protein
VMLLIPCWDILAPVADLLGRRTRVDKNARLGLVTKEAFGRRARFF